MAKRLTDLKAKEVSIVARGANKKTFLVVKEAEAEDKIFEILDAVAKGEEEFMKTVKGGDNPESRAIVKTAFRLFSGFKDKLTPEALILIAKGAGMKIEKEPEPEKITGETQSEVLKSLLKRKMISTKTLAKTAGVTEAVMKQVLNGEAVITSPEGIDALSEFLGIEKERLIAKEKEKPMGKPASIFKEDGTLNLEALPEGSREVVSLIYKQSTDTNTENKKLAQKIEKMEADQKREVAVAKAKEFSNLGIDTDTLTETLLEAKANLSEKAYENFENSLKKADTVAGASKIFEEVGRSRDHDTGSRPVLNTTGGEATQEVLKKAQGLVEKNDKLDIAAAINKVLKADPTLYERYRQETAVKV